MPSRWRWFVLLPIAIFLTACPYGHGDFDRPTVEWTFVNDTDESVFVNWIEPEVGGWSLLHPGEERTVNVLDEEGSDYLFRAHTLAPGRGRWSGSGGLVGGVGEPMGCYPVAWSDDLVDRVVTIGWQDYRDPRCWTDSEWVVENMTGVPVQIAVFMRAEPLTVPVAPEDPLFEFFSPSSTVKSTYLPFKVDQTEYFPIKGGLPFNDADERFMVMAFEFVLWEGDVIGWVAFEDPRAEHGNVYGAIGPLVTCDVLTMAELAASKFRLKLTPNVPDTITQDQLFPSEGNNDDPAYSDGHAWTPVEPDSISCEESALADSVVKRLDGPVDFWEIERAMIHSALEKGWITEAEAEEFDTEFGLY
jgi:hypothetical protein